MDDRTLTSPARTELAARPRPSIVNGMSLSGMTSKPTTAVSARRRPKVERSLLSPKGFFLCPWLKTEDACVVLGSEQLTSEKATSYGSANHFHLCPYWFSRLTRSFAIMFRNTTHVL